MNSRILAQTHPGLQKSSVEAVPAFRGSMLRIAVVAAICLLSVAGVHGQTAAPASAPGAVSTGKTGVINVRQAIVNTAEGKQASAELQSQFAPRQNELEGMNKQITELRQRLDASQGKLSAEEQGRLQRQGETLTRQLQRKQDEYTEDVNAAQADVFDRIGRKMVDVLDRYARENGYVVVLDSSAQNTPILYASNNIDVTQDIIHLYDQAYPVKSGGATTTPKPAAKPTTPPAAKPQR